MKADTPRIAVGAVVFDKLGRLLLVKRRYPPAPERWSIPGGHVELGEELKEAVIRELEEETGLKGYNPTLIAIAEYVSEDTDGRIIYHYIIIDFLIKEYRGELRPNEEVLDIGFFNLKEALNLKLTVTTRLLINALMTQGVSNGVIHIIYREVLKRKI
ncbi:MAG: DNA mismatch repair protein MutT [Desulfurococcales archaeon ex4484_42]|nr:MAG: DNA mismatch repair protein MutT [Desulfurococcales archaeon ex4484_42]